MNAGERYDYHGEMLTKSQIAKIGNLPWYIVDQRIKYGWSIDRIVNTPVRKLTLTKPKMDECDEIDEYACLECKRPKCIYDEV